MLSELVEELEIERDPEYLYYAYQKAIWRIKRSLPCPHAPEVVVELSKSLEKGYCYFLDQNGNLMRVKTDKD